MKPQTQEQVIQIQSINLGQRLALLSNGDVAPITHMYELNGIQTEDPALAIGFCVGYRGLFLADNALAFRPAVTH